MAVRLVHYGGATAATFRMWLQAREQKQEQGPPPIKADIWLAPENLGYAVKRVGNRAVPEHIAITE